jgi:type VI secretion system Hcp family effector
VKKSAVACLSLLTTLAIAVPSLAADSVYAIVKGAKQGTFAGDTAKGVIVYHLDMSAAAQSDAAGAVASGSRRQWNVRLTKALDKSSPQFLSAFVTNEPLTNVTITVYGPPRALDGRPSAGAEGVIYTIKLANARVVLDHVIAPADKDPASGAPSQGPVEEVSLTSQTVEVTAYGGTSSGTVSTSTDTWNILGNKAQ